MFKLLLLSLLTSAAFALRAPCTPLAVVSPYFSTWSCTDNLYDDFGSHWDGTTIGYTSFIAVNGEPYRLMGPEDVSGLKGTRSALQTDVVVKPTTTVYTFNVGDKIELTLSFITPSLNLDDESLIYNHLPTTYVSFSATSADGEDHDVKVYFDATAEGIIDDVKNEVEMQRNEFGGITNLNIGTTSQETLSGTSDRINWGYMHLNIPSDVDGLATTLSSDTSARQAFYNNENMPEDDEALIRSANDNWPVMAVSFNLDVAGDAHVPNTVFMTMTQDVVKSMNYFGNDILPFWTTLFESAQDMIVAGIQFFNPVVAATEAYDEKLMEDLTAAGGEKYAELLSLVHRQTTGATEKTTSLVEGDVWHWMKEISSDGDVSTVDVIYPAAPFFLYLAPETLRRMFMPLLVYSNNATGASSDYDYNLPWAAHHLGVWPVCDILAKDQEQMPVEESGNFLIMIAAVAQAQNGDVGYLDEYWPILKSWADYTVASLPDPGDQLCTDDFEGPSPHNVNLAAKGIVGLGAYAQLLELKGDADGSAQYINQAKALVGNWTGMGTDVDGTHTRLQFDLDDTFSLKYNLLFDKVLGLNLFPDSLIEADLQHYDSLANEYGVPLDNRGTFSKADWLMWVYALGSDSQFEDQVGRLWKFADETKDRVPLTDWYDTVTADQQGFQARPVLGGMYSKMIL